MRLLDTRFRGVALGVGQAPLLGRVHLAQMKIGSTYFGISFSVMDMNHPDLILGLDQLMKHLAHIDLAKNMLQIGSEKVQFLPEKDTLDSEFHGQHGFMGSRGFTPFQGEGRTLTPSSNTQGGERYPGNNGYGNTNSASNLSNSNNNNNPVSELMKLGFSHAECVKALREANGDLHLAANRLFGNV